jgi:hypothetical protein
VRGSHATHWFIFGQQQQPSCPLCYKLEEKIMYCEMSMEGFVVQRPYVAAETLERVPFIVIKLHAKYNRTCPDGNRNSWCQYISAKFMGEAFEAMLPMVDDGVVEEGTRLRIKGCVYPAFNGVTNEDLIGCEVRKFTVVV